MDVKRKKKRKNRKSFKVVFLLLLICAGIISLLLYAPIFNIKEVKVSGMDAVLPEEIIESSDVHTGTNIFKISLRNTEKNILKISRVDDVKVKRRIPNTIEIVVEETYPCLAYPFTSGFAVANEHGKVINLTDNLEEYTYPVVEGVEVVEAKTCEKIKVADEIAFDIISECILNLKNYEVLPLFKSIDFSNTSNLFAYTHEGTKIIFGKMTDMEYKVKVLADIINKVEKVEGAYVDLSTPSAAVYGIKEEEPTEEPTDENAENTENTENVENADNADNVDNTENTQELGLGENETGASADAE